MADGAGFANFDDAKERAHKQKSSGADGFEWQWPDPVDFLADANITGTPDIKPEYLPDAIAPFAFDTAARMGVDPSAVALTALVSCAAVVSDDWQVQPKRNDDLWTEAPRIRGAIVGDPSILKSPVIKACTRPIDRLEVEARKVHEGAMNRYRAELAVWKKEKEGEEPRHPVLDRYMVENLTVEALSEVLRDDSGATQCAPARKVLVRSDELAELLANLDRYHSGRGSGDRGAYLRLFNGGRHTVDRVGRGSFACPNWSACIVGGIQPGPIQKIARDAADDGLLQRFLYSVPAAQTVGLDQAPDRTALNRYERLFPALVALRPGGFAALSDRADIVVLHREAHPIREALDGLLAALKGMPDTSPRMTAALGKFPGIFARLCLLFHLINIADARASGEMGPPLQVIPEATAQRVLTYVRRCLLPHLALADALMFHTPQTGHARWLAGHILSRVYTRVTRRDITRAYGPLRAPECERDLTSVMSGLAAMGWVIEEERGNPARPPAAWLVNPKLYSDFADRAEQEREVRKQAKDKMTEFIRRDVAGRSVKCRKCRYARV